MLQYKNTTIGNLKLHMPSSEGTVTGMCYVNAAIGLPNEDNQSKIVRIRVEVEATNDDSDVSVIEATSISVFELDDGEYTRDAILDEAKNKCIPVAMKETSDLLAEATELLCGQRIVLPISDSQ